MANIPDHIGVSPMALPCPHCGANPGIACEVVGGKVELIHVERIEAAAALDVAAKKAQATDNS